MRRTTIFAEDHLLREIKEMANQEKRSVAELIRDALHQYIKSKRKTGAPLSFIGVAESGRDDVSEKHEELLWQKPT